MISYQYLCVNISQESFSTLLSDSPYSFRGVFSSRSTSAAFPASAAPETDAAPSDNDSSAQNILIAYFSNTGNTEEAAQQIADLTGGTLAEIQRAEDYDTIFVGYPIWWDEAPAMIATFLESYDFSGKTIIPFTSHGGSGFSGTIGTISELQPGATVLDNGLSVSRNHAADAQSDLADWISSLDIL